MVLLAKRVRANRDPVKMASTSSADEKRRMRSKISAACCRVSNFLLSLYLCSVVDELRSTNFLCRPSPPEYFETAPDSHHVPCLQPAGVAPCRSLECPTKSTPRASKSRPSNSKTPS